MMTIKVKEPESGAIKELKVKQVNNFTFPGWVVLIPGRRNVLLYLKNEQWHMVPETISMLYAQKIGEKLKELTH